jgi:hypothetical protein
MRDVFALGDEWGPNRSYVSSRNLCFVRWQMQGRSTRLRWRRKAPTCARRERKNNTYRDRCQCHYLEAAITSFQCVARLWCARLVLFDCSSRQLKVLVSPRTKDKGYPNGADYFELTALRDGVVEYLYFPDVDDLSSRDLLKAQSLKLK